MTKKQIEELRKAREKEFSIFQSDNEEFRAAMRELHLVEEGWDRNEAIVFLANTCRPK